MQAASFMLLIAMLTVTSATIGASECEVDGIPERWALAACFAEFQTDDELHPGVIECFNEWSEQRSDDACAENEASKRQLCEITLRYADHHESVDACVADQAYVPTVVAEGVGG